MKAATTAGFTEATIKRAGQELGVTITNTKSMPRRTMWSFGEDPESRERRRKAVLDYLETAKIKEQSERTLAALAEVNLTGDARRLFFDEMRKDGLLAIVRTQSDGTIIWAKSLADGLQGLFGDE